MRRTRLRLIARAASTVSGKPVEPQGGYLMIDERSGLAKARSRWLVGRSQGGCPLRVGETRIWHAVLPATADGERLERGLPRSK
jgi:hypothetical protein